MNHYQTSKDIMVRNSVTTFHKILIKLSNLGGSVSAARCQPQNQCQIWRMNSMFEANCTVKRAWQLSIKFCVVHEAMNVCKILKIHERLALKNVNIINLTRNSLIHILSHEFIHVSPKYRQTCYNKHQSVRLGNVFVCVHCSYVSAHEQLQEKKSASGETSGSNRHYNENKYIYKYTILPQNALSRDYSCK